MTIYYVIDADGTYNSNNPHYSRRNADKLAALVNGDVEEVEVIDIED